MIPFLGWLWVVSSGGPLREPELVDVLNEAGHALVDFKEGVGLKADVIIDFSVFIPEPEKIQGHRCQEFIGLEASQERAGLAGNEDGLHLPLSRGKRRVRKNHPDRVWCRKSNEPYDIVIEQYYG
jgi:hypothetical protein